MKETRPRIGFVSLMDGGAWGGSEALWAAASGAALTAGHAVAISSRRWPSDPAPILDLEARGARVFRRKRAPKGIRRAFGAPFRAFAAFRPDVVCVNQGETYDAIRSRKFAALTTWLERSRVPYVVLCHGNTGAPRSDAKRQRARAFFATAQHITFPARRMLELAEQQLLTSLANAVVLQNPVNLDDLDPLPWPEALTPEFGLISRLEWLKGIDVVLEALCTDVWAQREWRLRIAGDGPDRAYYEQLAAHLGLGDRVRFLGHRPDVREIWSACHLGLLASRSEGLPLAVVEAMVCGRPVVVSDVGAVRELVVEERHGFIAEAPTPLSFARALERAWAARARWPEMGCAARERALAGLTPPPGEVLLELLREAAAHLTRAAVPRGAGGGTLVGLRPERHR